MEPTGRHLSQVERLLQPTNPSPVPSIRVSRLSIAARACDRYEVRFGCSQQRSVGMPLGHLVRPPQPVRLDHVDCNLQQGGSKTLGAGTSVTRRGEAFANRRCNSQHSRMTDGDAQGAALTNPLTVDCLLPPFTSASSPLSSARVTTAAGSAHTCSPSTSCSPHSPRGWRHLQVCGGRGAAPHSPTDAHRRDLPPGPRLAPAHLLRQDARSDNGVSYVR